MEFVLDAPELSGRTVTVRAGGVLGLPRLLVDGVPATATAGRYRIETANGGSVEIRLVRRGDDPFPDIFINGSKIADPLPPFSWHHEMWIWLPFPLLCWFGIRGAFLGAIAVTVNATLFRRARSPWAAYAATASCTTLVTLAGYLLMRDPTELVALWMTWIVLHG
jgi:hypothetical protein